MHNRRTRSGSRTKSQGQHNANRRPSQTNTTPPKTHHEAKEPENQHETLRQLCEALSTEEQPLVWYVANYRHAAGHVISKRQATSRIIYLIKTMTNKLVLASDNHIIHGVPRDISSRDVLRMMQYLPNLTSAFEVRANIHVTLEEAWMFTTTRKSVVQEIVVRSFRLPPTLYPKTHVEVKDPSVLDAWTSCALTSLKVVMPSLTAVSSMADAEELQRCKDALTRSEFEHNKLQANFDEQCAVNESLQAAMLEERRNHERKKSEMTDRRNQCERQIRTLQTKLSEKERQIRSVNDKATINRNELEKVKRAKAVKESELRDVQNQLQQQQAESDRQANEFREKVDELTTTIRAYEQKQLTQKQEISRLREEADRNYRKVRQLEEILPVYEHQQKVLAAEREKNEKLQNDVYEKEQKLTELLGLGLLPSYSGLNFCSEMSELRNERHDEAIDACEELDIPQEQTLDLLFRIFMFCYEYFEGKMTQFRSMLNLDGKETLERLFIVKMQENYEALFDGEGLKRAYLETFSQELAHGCADHRIEAYVLACGELCWSVVLHLPKLEFLPRESTIDPDGEMMFDSSKFKDFAGGKNSKARVLSYVLPGLFRVGSDVAIGTDAMPCVFTKKMKPLKRKSALTPSVVSSRVTKNERPPVKAAEIDKQALLEGIETDVWNGDVADAKNKLQQMKLSVYAVKILCGNDGCDAELFGRWSDYERAVRNGGCIQCPVDDAHDGVRIQKK